MVGIKGIIEGSLPEMREESQAQARLQIRETDGDGIDAPEAGRAQEDDQASRLPLKKR
jgi:hypothetical protein